MERTPAQRAAIGDNARRFCVDAGAGSGKTLVLVERIVRLVNDGTPLDRIVAITFTDKAAAEMKSRLRAAFRKQAPGDDSEAAARWRDRERAVDNARICTIHAFCTGILREHALRLGIDPEFAPLAEHESSLLIEETVRDAVLALLESGDASALALCAAYPPRRVSRMIANMLTQDASIAEIAAACPTESDAALRAAWAAAVAAEEDAHFTQLRGDPAVRAFLRELERFDGAFTGTEPDARERIRRAQLALLRLVAEGGDPDSVAAAVAGIAAIGQNRAGKEWSDGEVKNALKGVQDEVREWIARNLKPIEESEPDAAASATLTRHLLAAYHAVRAAHVAAKAEANRLSFDDLIAHSLEALRGTEALRNLVAAGIDTLLIDEFQDTDGHQLEIAELLHGAEAGPDLFIVGDAKQSIYYFRGAEVEVFADARDKSLQVERLDANFRTLPGVLAFVNDYFHRSDALHAVERRYHPMIAGRAGAPPWVPVEFLIHVADGGKREALRTAEAELVARRIAALLDPARSDAGVWDGDANAPRPAQPGDVALLFRSMSNVGLYEDAMRRLGIPYTLASGAGFYERQEVIDVLNALRVVLDPYDEPALLGFLRGPMVGLSDNALYLWVRSAKSLARAFAGEVPEGVMDAEETGAVARARALVAELRARATDAPGMLLRHLLEETAYEAVLLSQYLGLQKAANLRKLVAQADTFQYGGVRSLRAFARYLDDVRSNAVREGEAALPGAGGAVQLLTIHKSKGLEFPIVFLVDTATPPRAAESGDVMRHRALGLVCRAPDEAGAAASPAIVRAIQRRVRREEHAEHARLLYVALTRARDRLIVSGAADAGRTGEPVAPSGSWLAAFDEAYHVLSKSDDHLIEKPDWQARVRHGVPDTGALVTAGEQDAAPDTDALARNAAPLAPPRRADVFSVSALLDAMAGGFDPEEERGVDPEADRAPGAGARDAMLRGALVHAVLEGWNFREGAAPPLESLLDAWPLTQVQRAQWRDDLAALAARFGQSALHARMAASGRVQREAPFHLYLPDCDAGIAGVMDAVLDDGTIIDYKTGAKHPDRHARYEWQLLLYAAAYQELRASPPREGLIHYVDQDRTEAVDFGGADVAAARRHAAELIARLRAG